MQRLSILLIVSVIFYGMIWLMCYGVNRPYVESLKQKEEIQETKHEMIYYKTICNKCHKRRIQK